MKASRKAISAFVLAWLIATIFGYLLSRDRIFAAGGAPPACVECLYCDEWSQIGGLAHLGYTLQGTRTPWVATALIGPMNGGSPGYSDVCNSAGEASEIQPPVPLTIWNTIGGSQVCTPASPPPKGTYEQENSAIASGTGFINQSECINTD